LPARTPAEDVVALAIEELGVEPLREDCELLLRETRSG
jgi:hypothetical protein